MLYTQSKDYFALVDCNDFYASCERVFNPSLKNTPIVVLSNNDGCIIARSEEAKQLGIPMAAPYHQYKELMLRHGVKVFSSNYQLYGDMSQRVMDSLQLMGFEMEIYSIDEAFLKINVDSSDLLACIAKDIRSTIAKWLGLPVSVGIGKTKVLAKLANSLAKQDKASGICVIEDHGDYDETFKSIPVEKIWGISKKLGQRLRLMNIHSVYDLKYADATLIRKKLTVLGQRIVYELNGTACLDLNSVVAKKHICASRSFGKDINSKSELAEAIATYAARACEKLRTQNSKSLGIYLFLRTNKFKKLQPQHNVGSSAYFDYPTSNTLLIIQHAKKILDEIYNPSYNYHKAGIILFDIVPSHQEQQCLFTKNEDTTKSSKLMGVMDDINRTVGKNSIFSLSQGITKDWLARSNNKSPCYTTKWTDLPIVK